jgi:glycosyltransferase involved in cell wall biosynthesis
MDTPNLSCPKISIITPSFNQGEFIEETIRSVLNQQYENFEHIVMDGGSTDQTLSILRKYSHLVWVSESDRGQSDALNKGFKCANGEIVGWLNSDDYYLPKCFQMVAENFVNEPSTDVLHGNYRWIDKDGKLMQRRRELRFDMFMLKYLHMLYIPTTATFFHRRVFDEANFLDIDYRYAMDYEFFLRLAMKGYRFVHIDAFLADFRWHAQSKTESASHKQLEEQRKALLEYDPVLRTLPPPVRGGARALLTGVARTKRMVLKAVRGYYFDQWARKSVL